MATAVEQGPGDARVWVPTPEGKPAEKAFVRGCPVCGSNMFAVRYVRETFGSGRSLVYALLDPAHSHGDKFSGLRVHNACVAKGAR